MKTEVMKYRLIYWGQQGLGDLLSHTISGSALMPALPSQELDQTLPDSGQGWVQP